MSEFFGQKLLATLQNFVAKSLGRGRKHFGQCVNDVPNPKYRRALYIQNSNFPVVEFRADGVQGHKAQSQSHHHSLFECLIAVDLGLKTGLHFSFGEKFVHGRAGA